MCYYVYRIIMHIPCVVNKIRRSRRISFENYRLTTNDESNNAPVIIIPIRKLKKGG